MQATIRGTSLGLPLEQWMLNGQTIVPLSDGPVGTKALRLNGASGAYPNQGNYVPLDRTKKYRIKFWARPSSDATGALYFSLRQFLDDTGTAGPVNDGRSPYRPSGKSRTQHIAQYGDTWGEYNFVWSSVDWQDGVKFVQPEFLDNYSVGAGYWDLQGFTFTDVTETEELTATIQTLATTTAGPDGLTAQYTVKTDVAGHVAGFGLSSSGNKSTEVATGVLWGDVATAITRASAGRQPELSKFGETINGRMVGDTNNSGTLSSADGLNISKFEFGISLATDIYDYINITLRQILYSNLDKYREYLVLDTTGSTTSEFAVTADRFYIAPPAIVSSVEPEATLRYPGFTWVDSSVFPNITKYWSGTAWVLKPTNLPFIVQTSPEEINGTMVPAGVYIDTAYIRDATITTAKIADLAVDNGKIANLNADKITAGFISVDRIEANSIVADKIDTRGLSIKDSAGNIILAAGTALNVSNVTGLGTLATANSVDYSNLTGTKPPSDADKTSSNIAAGITDQGDFATLDQITSGNISTYIADLAVGTAQIAELAVDNAKIGNYIKSSDFNGTINASGNITDVGTTGWAIGKGNGTDGVAVFQNIVARGDIEVPEASISSAKISELAVDTLKIQGGAITFTAIQELTNNWASTNSTQIGFIDFSQAAQDGALLKVIVQPLGTQQNTYLSASSLQVSVDGSTWVTLFSNSGTSIGDNESGYSYVFAQPPYTTGIPVRLSPTVYGAPARAYWWGTSTRARELLTEMAVWPASNYGGTVSMSFTLLLPFAETYTLYYCADDRVDSGSFGTPQSGVVSLSPYQFQNNPNTLSYTANGTNQIATLNVVCTDTGSLEGFAAYLVRNSTGETIWNVRRPNYTADIFRYARVMATKEGTTPANVQAWFGVEIIRR